MYVSLWLLVGVCDALGGWGGVEGEWMRERGEREEREREIIGEVRS